ncbi:MAG TPA: EamA family transporter [Mycobacteriales bacterium]|nr:EamA family transporter [Mycobacteriales bacterium]
MTKTPAKVWAALVVVYVVWGSTYLGIRYAIAADTGDVGLPPLLMGAVRFGIAGLVLLAWGVRRPHPDGEPDPIGWRQWRAAALVGIALITGGNGLVMLGEQRITSGVAAVLVTTTPLWLALLAFILGRERLPRVGVVGLVLGFLGVAILADPRGAEIDSTGAVMVLLASVSWSAGSYYSRHAPMPRRPIVMTGMEMLCGAGAMGVISVVSGDASSLRLTEVDLRPWLAFGYLLVFGSMLAFTAYVWLLRNARLSLVGTYAFVNPVVAVGLGALPPLREPLGPRTLVASAVIVAGVALIVLGKGRGEKTVASVGPGPSSVDASDQEGSDHGQQGQGRSGDQEAQEARQVRHSEGARSGSR